jgi:hypothetical protein
MTNRLYRRIKTGLKYAVVAWASAIMGYPI